MSTKRPAPCSPTSGEGPLKLMWSVSITMLPGPASVRRLPAAQVRSSAGQPSRVDSVKIAAAKGVEMGRAAGLSEPPTRGSVVASDAFYPFADGLEAAIAAGATAAIQPGGSRRDAEVIAAADQAGIAMVFTGIRHFRH